MPRKAYINASRNASIFACRNIHDGTLLNPAVEVYLARYFYEQEPFTGEDVSTSGNDLIADGDNWKFPTLQAFIDKNIVFTSGNLISDFLPTPDSSSNAVVNGDELTLGSPAFSFYNKNYPSLFNEPNTVYEFEVEIVSITEGGLLRGRIDAGGAYTDIGSTTGVKTFSLTTPATFTDYRLQLIVWSTPATIVVKNFKHTNTYPAFNESDIAQAIPLEDMKEVSGDGCVLTLVDDVITDLQIYKGDTPPPEPVIDTEAKTITATTLGMTESQVDDYLVAATSLGYVGYIFYFGGTNAAPSATGIAAISTLQGQGNTVYTN